MLTLLDDVPAAGASQAFNLDLGARAADFISIQCVYPVGATVSLEARQGTGPWYTQFTWATSGRIIDAPNSTNVQYRVNVSSFTPVAGFTGAGLNDITFSGAYSGSDPAVFTVEVVANIAAVAAAGTIVCPAAADLQDGETVTISDGTNPASVFEFEKKRAAAGTIVCPVAASIADGETVTLNDGANPASVFEFEKKVAAAGTIACVPQADLLDGETVTLNDGTNPASVFEFEIKKAAVGGITCPVPTALLDGEAVTLDDGVNVASVFEFEKKAYAVGTITCVAKANLIDGETVTIDDGVNAPTVFEFDVAGDGVAGANVQVNVSTDVTDDDVAARLHLAINGVGAGLAITVVSDVGGVLTLQNDATGGLLKNAAITHTVADAGFVVTGMSGGAGDGVGVGNVEVDITACATAVDVAAALHAAINGVVAGLAITSTDNLDGTLSLVNDATGGLLKNAAITDTVVDAGFTHTGMSGGSGDGVTPGNVEVDVSASVTAIDVAAVLHAAINGVGAGLAITSTDPLTGTLNLANDATGAAGNQAISDTVANAGFTHTGMSGGSGDGVTPGNVEVDISASVTAVDVAGVLHAAINAVGAGLAITSTDPGTGTLNLANDATGVAGNQTITDTVANVGFTHTGMSGGSGDGVAGANVEVDISAAVTAVDVAGVLHAAINGVIAGLAVTSTDPGTGTLNLANDATGPTGNVAITDTVVAGTFTHTGMSGGDTAYDTVRWKKDSGAWTTIRLTGAAQLLSDAVSITAGAVVGHTPGDAWTSTYGGVTATASASGGCRITY